MNYSVFWVPDAEQELAAIWLFPLQYVIQCVKQRTFLIIRINSQIIAPPNLFFFE